MPQFWNLDVCDVGDGHDLSFLGINIDLLFVFFYWKRITNNSGPPLISHPAFMYGTRIQRLIDFMVVYANEK